MLCEKCKVKPAKVHIKQKAQGSTGDALGGFIEHHFCKDCGRDFIQSDPRLRTGIWSKPEKRFIMEIPDRTNRREPS